MTKGYDESWKATKGATSSIMSELAPSGPVVTCPNCGGRFQRGNLSCCVAHPPGSMTHKDATGCDCLGSGGRRHDEPPVIERLLDWFVVALFVVWVVGFIAMVWSSV